ncbi:MAG TPA: large conductance mechanosensitive channel protein MscL [Tepidisphaeraceae bacterium]|jgi:large conductance mechanosensitive channel|nr:large conductance mechanosensitive channel protein MscL [Tepidisphaeraceae bacterium]
MKLWQEFKEFAFKGNMIDLAIAVVIGAAFGKVIDAVVKNLFLPTLSYIPGLHGGWEHWAIGKVQIGPFLAELLNFLIIALAVFLVIVKGLQLLKGKQKPPPPPGEPTIKECPFCLSEIPFRASRCKNCTADQPTTAVVGDTKMLPTSG